VYDAKNGFGLLYTCSAPTAVTQLDFSLDSQFLQGCSADYALTYFNCANGERIKDVAELRDVEWVSHPMHFVHHLALASICCRNCRRGALPLALLTAACRQAGHAP